MKVIAFGTLKGGTGKTTVAYNIGGILAEEHKVLFIDMDPQANLTDNAGVDTTRQDGITVRDIFRDPKISPENVIVKQPMWQYENLDIIPSHIRLTATEMQLVSTPAREHILRRWIERNRSVLEQYDYIIIDTNPSMGVVNQNAFMAADAIVLVSDVSRKALQGAQLFTYLWGEVAEAMQLEDKVKALILNNHDKRIALGKYLMEFYQDDEEFGNIVLKTTIPARVDIKNTELKYLPINVTAPDSDSCEAFRNVISELREKEVI